MAITTFTGQETVNLFSKLNPESQNKLKELSKEISFKMVINEYIENIFTLNYKELKKENNMLITKYKELAYFLVDYLDDNKTQLEFVKKLSFSFPFTGIYNHTLIDKDKILFMSSSNIKDEFFNNIKYSLLFRGLYEDILKSSQNGLNEVSYKILYNERHKYSGLKNELFHLNRENKIYLLIKYLKSLNYSVKKIEIIKRNIFFKKKIVGFEFEISWDE